MQSKPPKLKSKENNYWGEGVGTRAKGINIHNGNRRMTKKERQKRKEKRMAESLIIMSHNFPK